MTSETIKVSVTYGNTITFFLRMIGIAEESQLRQKMFGLTEAEKAEKQYQLNVDMLADLSVQMPDGMFPNKPKELGPGTQPTYIENFSTPAEAVRAFFEEQSVTKERTAYFAVNAYLVRLQPEESFL
ncbi:MAG TPA: hypothetical protein VF599_12390 [Pyrinomonadaceae bacterium]|jgi:hypothetical protein